MCLRGGVKLVDGGHGFQDGLALSDAFRDVVGSQSDFTGDICCVADCTTEMEIAWESDGKQWLYYAGLGLLNPVAYYLVLFKAYDLLPAQVAQPINYAWPIVLLILLALFAGQPIHKKKYIGMFVSLAGVALISIGTGFNGEMNVSTEGFLLAALSAVLWATYWMLNNRNKVQTDGSVVLFLTFLFGSVYLSVGALFCGLNLSSLTGVLSGMYVGGFEMGIPFIFFGLAMRKTSNPALINQLCYLSPFMSLFFISVVLGEQIVFTTYIGLVMIVLGIVFNQYFVKSSNQAKIVQ